MKKLYQIIRGHTTSWDDDTEIIECDVTNETEHYYETKSKMGLNSISKFDLDKYAFSTKNDAINYLIKKYENDISFHKRQIEETINKINGLKIQLEDK